MTTYNVHIYREMRIVFGGIEAETPEAAAAIARNKPTDEADEIADCDGEDLAALIDVAGDGEYEQSVMIDFEAERQRKAAGELLAACQLLNHAYRGGEANGGSVSWEALDEAWASAAAAVAGAEASGIRPEPSAPRLLAALRAILPYAEDEAYALEKLKDSPEAEAEVERAWGRIEAARSAIAEGA